MSPHPCQTGAMNTTTLELNEPSRRDFLGLLARLPLIPAAALRPRPRDRAIARQVPMNEFPIAGFRDHDGADALPLLQSGTVLTLRAQADNPHDPHAVEILYGALKLGYVPRFCNRHLSQLLQNDVSLTCEVARINADAPPWDAVAVRVSLPQPQLLAA